MFGAFVSGVPGVANGTGIVTVHRCWLVLRCAKFFEYVTEVLYVSAAISNGNHFCIGAGFDCERLPP